jgi:outer membrane protein
MMKQSVVAMAMLAASAGVLAQSSPAPAPSPSDPVPVVNEPDGNWLVRLRAVRLDSANKDGTGSNLSINDKWLPEADISYFFTPNWAAELVLTYPQKHSMYSAGAKIGSLKELPPTLMAQYHFTDLGNLTPWLTDVKPYLGLGLNYTRFSSVNIQTGDTPVDVKRSSWGPALQAGVDYAVTKSVYLNLDIKKVWIKTDVKASGSDLGSFKVDPVLLGVGVGYRF